MEGTRRVEHLLWPNDLSECSEKAIAYVRSLAKRYGAAVHVLYVAEGLAHHEPWYGEFGTSHVDRIIEYQIQVMGQRLQQFCSKHLRDCATYETTVAIGNPARKILEYIDEKKIDMVVMCRKGKTGDFDMGSVAQKIVMTAPVPVVIAPGEMNNNEGGSHVRADL